MSTRNTGTVTFNYPGQGKVEIPIEKCREVCPAETAAMEAAATAIAEAQKAGDMTAVSRATEDWGRRFEALHQCMLQEARKRLDSSAS